MRHPLVEALRAPDPAAQVGVLESFAAGADTAALACAASALHDFAADPAANVYQRVRALFQASAIYRYHLPGRSGVAAAGRLPAEGHAQLLQRRWAEAIETFRQAAATEGWSEALASALAAGYYGQGFEVLAQQVQRSVQSLRGNRWMFRLGHAGDHPLRLRAELLRRGETGAFPLLAEETPVRMDLSHSGWSDIFFLGMDYPEGARVLNVSVDLAVRGRDDRPRPPIRCFLRVLPEPVLRLTSVDLGATADLTEVADIFDVARDYLGLLKAAVIAGGLVPPGLEGSGQSIRAVLDRVVGPGLGLELVSQVNDIPKGSRLAVSTNLLASLLAVLMRATGQVAALTGELAEEERRIIAGRAILGEWLGGSGGGWQDSGGIWPGIKLIEGVAAGPEDVEHGSSRGRLLPRHTVLGLDEVAGPVRQALQRSLVVVHGGMAANVGPILEMVTEKYLLGLPEEWAARAELQSLFGAIRRALGAGDIRELGRLTTRNFRGPLQAIIPWVSNAFTERLIAEAEAAFGDQFWGFWMLGGMSGGGMGFIFDPEVREAAVGRMQAILAATKERFAAALPFAMEPVVYDFALNERGSVAELLTEPRAVLPAEYYLLHLPSWLSAGARGLSPERRREIEAFSGAHLAGPSAARTGPALVRRLVPAAPTPAASGPSLADRLAANGFDAEQHEAIRADLRAGRIGLAQNRLPADTLLEDVRPEDVVPAAATAGAAEAGRALLRAGAAAVVTLAAGAGSRWTQGAGTVKALHPFARLGGRFRSFLDVHFAKTRRAARLAGAPAGHGPVHVVTTSYLTHEPVAAALARDPAAVAGVDVRLSPGRSIGLRLVPMARDLRFAWEETAQQQLEARKERVRESGRRALLDWAVRTGEGSDYTDNLPAQCLHPVGHWFEVANLLRNGVLAQLLAERPALQYLLLHNVDTLGADLDPALLGWFADSGATLAFEVIGRRLEDHGGGLARVNGRVRLVEGLALPRAEDEFRLTYYNSATTWIAVDPLLAAFGLDRAQLGDAEAVRRAVRALAARVPTYVTLKDVKRRWGHAQEDVFPVAQWEKLWGDMSALPGVDARFLVVPRARGQQLKDPAQLDGWARDGSRAWVESIGDFAD